MIEALIVVFAALITWTLILLGAAQLGVVAVHVRRKPQPRKPKEAGHG